MSLATRLATAAVGVSFAALAAATAVGVTTGLNLGEVEHATEVGRVRLTDEAVEALFDATVAQALDSLPTKFRRPVELVDIGGMSYQEAADEMGVPVGTVMSRLHRARKKMRDHLERAGYGTKEID